MDSIDIVDNAFSLAGLPDMNEVIEPVKNVIENTDTNIYTNILVIIGIIIFIGGIFVYSYLTNRKKTVTFDESNNVYSYENR